jgi:PAS domain S-box-containing protein
VLILAIYGLSLFFYLNGHVRAQRAELNAAYAMARAANMARMKELEERFQRLVAASSIGQLVVNEEGQIELSNPAAEQMLGYNSSELNGMLVDKLLPDRLQDKHVQLRKQYMRAPQARKMGESRELQAVKKQGTSFPVEVGLNPYTDQGRKLILVSIIDLSDRVRVDQVDDQSLQS